MLQLTRPCELRFRCGPFGLGIRHRVSVFRRNALVGQPIEPFRHENAFAAGERGPGVIPQRIAQSNSAAGERRHGGAGRNRVVHEPAQRVFAGDQRELGVTLVGGRPICDNANPTPAAKASWVALSTLIRSLP